MSVMWGPAEILILACVDQSPSQGAPQREPHEVNFGLYAKEWVVC